MAEAPALIIDSFLAVDGRVTGLEVHRQRFTESVRSIFGEALASEIPAVYAALTRDIASGRRFPRISATAAAVNWEDRLAPPQGDVLRVSATPKRDVRNLPQHKGPELAWLQEVAADGEVVLLRDQFVAETTTAAIIVLTDDRAIAPNAPSLPSTTAAWFAARVHPINRQPITFAELASASDDGRAFALNALHGVRPLVIGDAEPSEAATALATRWRSQWFDDAEPMV